MNFSPPLSRRFMVARLSPSGEVFRIEADEAARQAIAAAYGLPSVSRFVADFRLSLEGKAGARLKGMLEADYEQLCVVTLEPFAQRMREPVELAFAPAAVADEEELEVEFSSEDPPEPIENGEIDAGHGGLRVLRAGA